MPTRREFASAVVALGLAGAASPALGASSIIPSRAPIRAARRRDDTMLRLGGSGDNYNMTWATDDRLLLTVDDGYGWQDQIYYNTRLWAMTGPLTRPAFQELGRHCD